MIHILLTIAMIIKAVIFFLNRDLFSTLTLINIIVLLLFILLNYILKKNLYKQKQHSNIKEHLKQYRFWNKKEYYFSLIGVIIYITLFISLIFYLRIKAYNNPINFNAILYDIQVFYDKTNLSICLYKLTLFTLIFNIFHLSVKIVKKKLDLLMMKLHFFLLSYESYVKTHNFFRKYCSLEAIIISHIRHVIFIFPTYLCFGYFKDPFNKFDDVSETNIINQKIHWTIHEKKRYTHFLNKYQKIFWSLERYIIIILYHAHLIVFIYLFIFDIFFSNHILIYTAKTLPLIFLYQLYITLCNFVMDKPTHDIPKDINILYYHKVIILNKKTVMIDDEISENSFDETFIKEFLRYELQDFVIRNMLKININRKMVKILFPEEMRQQILDTVQQYLKQ